MMHIRSLLLAAVLSLSAYTSLEAGTQWVIKDETPLSTASRRGQANFHVTSDGNVILVWFENVEKDRYALRFAVRERGRWLDPKTIAEGNPFAIHWAELPSLVELPDGKWFVSWLERVKKGEEFTRIKGSISHDKGVTWRPSIALHRDDTPAYRSSVSMLPWGRGEVALMNLEGREITGSEQKLKRETKIRFATFYPDGKQGLDYIIDDLACDCCRTALARTARGLVAAYRNRDNKETRDIVIVRYVDGSWTRPMPVQDDGWIFDGCPLNGPALSTSGDTVAIAWFTGARDVERVFVAFSDDAGATFGVPVVVNDGFSFGRVDIELVSDDTAIVSWLEGGKEGAVLMARPVMKDGAMEEAFLVSQSGGASIAAIPRMTRVGEEMLFAWMEAGKTGSLKVASVTQNREEEGNSLSTPQQAFDALVEAILSGDKAQYERLLDRPLNKYELGHIVYINKNPGSRIKAISPVNILSRGFEETEEGRRFCIDQRVEIIDESGNKRDSPLKTCFRKVGQKWLYVPEDIRLFQ